MEEWARRKVAQLQEREMKELLRLYLAAVISASLVVFSGGDGDV